MDIQQIQSLIPHRPPFLWIDEVVEIDESHIRATRHVPADLDVFQGHYPDFPVLPGVLICEAIFQAGAVLIASQHTPAPGQVPVVTRQNNTKFRRMVRPGETLTLEATLTEQVSGAFFLTGSATVDNKTAVRLEFACTLTTTEG